MSAARTVALQVMLLGAGLTSVRAQQVPIRAPRPDLRISADKEDLSRIVALAVDTGGRIVVSQPDDSRFVVHDRDGKRIATFGRPGSGPGEFRAIGIGRGWVADTFWQFDLGTRRVTRYAMPGTLLRSDLIQITAAAESGVSLILPLVIAVRPDRSVLVWSPVVRAGPASGWAAALSPSAGSAVVEVSPSGHVERLVAGLPGLFADECEQHIGGQTFATPECQGALWAASPAGRHLASVSVREMGDGRQVVVASIGAAGDTVFTRLELTAPLPIGRTTRIPFATT